MQLIDIGLFSEVEASILATTTSFMARLDDISIMPINNEADVAQAGGLFNQLISDMQAFSNIFTEGHQRGRIPGTDLERVCIQIPEAAFAQGGQGQEPHPVA